VGEFVRHRQTTLRARILRKEPTVADAALWEILRAHRLENWGFRRQAAVAGYVADFVCHDPKLVVEVDGPIHDRAEQAAFDKKRDEEMESAGYAVIRLDERLA
jgi:very-short-patch-repair endonuclease